MVKNVSITVQNSTIKGTFASYDSLSLLSNGEIGEVTLKPEENAHSVLRAENIKNITIHDRNGIYNITAAKGIVSVQVQNFNGSFEVSGKGSHVSMNGGEIDGSSWDKNVRRWWGHLGIGISRLYLHGFDVFCSFQADF